MRPKDVLCALAVALAAAAPAHALPARGAAPATAGPATVVVGYETEAALRAALERRPARVVRLLPRLRTAEVRPLGRAEEWAAAAARLPGIAYAEAPRPRRRASEPGLAFAPGSRAPYQWQWAATRHDAVPEWAQRAAASVTVAVVDTGADLAAPDLAAKAPAAYDVRTGAAAATDAHGHGTFVASLAAGSVTNGEGIAGAGGDARLLVVKAASTRRAFTDVDAAAGIVHAVNAGARVVNLSFGGPLPSAVERRAVEYAVARGVLLVAAVGNEFERGNHPQYPAALLQPLGSRGEGGAGLAVAASTPSGGRAAFSNTGTHVSLAAPGEEVLGAVSALASPAVFPRVPLPGSLAGHYGFASGTSFAAPQVAGAAALVWGVAPHLTAAEVAAVLKETARGRGWTPALGHGVLDAAAAVARAAAPPAAAAPGETALTLTASQTRAAQGRAVVAVDALLAGPAPHARPLALERLDRGTWTRVAQGTTGTSGAVAWRFSLAPGSYRLRARFPGAADLPPATSAPVTIAVR